MGNHCGVESRSNDRVISADRVSPVSLLQRGKSIARLAPLAMRVNGKWSKRRLPVMGQIEV